MELPPRVELIEVGLRDGLQNQPVTLSTERKLELVRCLIGAGFRRLQVASFVHPERVPQMADAEELFKALPRHPQVVYSALVLNRKGLERARIAGLEAVDMSLSASDAHSRRNANVGFDEAMERFSEMFESARGHQMKVRAGIQCAFGFTEAGEIPLERLSRIVKRFLELGVDELTLADSAGLADPRQVEAVLAELMPILGATPVVLHLHDTRGLGLANVLAALQAGVDRFDTALGGLGGCPFIDGAAGNIASEDTLYLLDSLGIDTGVDREAVAGCSGRLEKWLGIELPSKLYRLSHSRAVA